MGSIGFVLKLDSDLIKGKYDLPSCINIQKLVNRNRPNFKLLWIFFFFNKNFETHLFAFVLRGQWNVKIDNSLSKQMFVLPAFMHDWITTSKASGEKYRLRGLTCRCRKRRGTYSGPPGTCAGCPDRWSCWRCRDTGRRTWTGRFSRWERTPVRGCVPQCFGRGSTTERRRWLFPFMKPDTFRKRTYSKTSLSAQLVTYQHSVKLPSRCNQNCCHPGTPAIYGTYRLHCQPMPKASNRQSPWFTFVMFG